MIFDHVTLPQRVLFGSGRAASALRGEVDHLGGQRIMVISSAREAPVAAAITAGLAVTVRHDGVVQHVPAELAAEATTLASRHGIDLVVAVGGGSAIGLAKAIAKQTRLPVIAIPTTYSGSEATNVWGITESGRKVTGTDDGVLPVSIIYDPQLTVSLPVGLSIASGLNALAHCIDAMWAPRTNPINQMMAAEGIRLLAAGLPMVKDQPDRLDGREQTLLGAYLSAVAFAAAGSGLHHKICHVLGGTYNMPHAQTHAIVLPQVLAFNATAAPEAEARIATAFGADGAIAGLQCLRTRLDAPKALQDYGFQADDIPEAAELIQPVVPASNPRSVSHEDLETILHAALVGASPLPGKDSQS